LTALAEISLWHNRYLSRRVYYAHVG
jgi:hypothetical protein